MKLDYLQILRQIFYWFLARVFTCILMPMNGANYAVYVVREVPVLSVFSWGRATQLNGNISWSLESHNNIYTYPSWIVSKLLRSHWNHPWKWGKNNNGSLKNLPYKVGLMSIFLEDGGKQQMPIAIQWDVDEWSYLHRKRIKHAINNAKKKKNYRGIEVIGVEVNWIGVTTMLTLVAIWKVLQCYNLAKQK